MGYPASVGFDRPAVLQQECGRSRRSARTVAHYPQPPQNVLFLEDIYFPMTQNFQPGFRPTYNLCRLRELHKYNQIIHLTSHNYTHCIILIGISIQSHESVSWRISTEHRHFRPTVMEPTEEDSVPLLNLNNLP